MLNIERINYVTINGTKIAEMPEELLLEFVCIEEAKIKTIEEMETMSDAIEAIKRKHKDNIIAIIAELEDRMSNNQSKK